MTGVEKIKLAFSKQESVNLVASENILLRDIKDVLLADIDILDNRYVEGYIGRRYYPNCKALDDLEIDIHSRLQDLFGYRYSNIHAMSGAIANVAIYNAVFMKAEMNKTILHMNVNNGGHISHSSLSILSGNINFISYGTAASYLIDYNEIEEKAFKYRPGLIISGYSSYTEDIDHIKFKNIADKVGALYLYDASHTSGFVARSLYGSSQGYADIFMSTTHKMFRGLKGAIILCNDESISRDINRSLFPSIQGGYNAVNVALNSLVFQNLSSADYLSYLENVLYISDHLIRYLLSRRVRLLSDSSTNHIILIDIQLLNIKGSELMKEFAKIGIYLNYGGCYRDSSFNNCTALRIGTAYIGNYMFNVDMISLLADIIASIYHRNYHPNDIRNKVITLYRLMKLA